MLEIILYKASIRNSVVKVEFKTGTLRAFSYSSHFHLRLVYQGFDCNFGLGETKSYSSFAKEAMEIYLFDSPDDLWRQKAR